MQGLLASNKKPWVLLLEEKEDDNAIRIVYLITISRVKDACLPDGRAYQDLSTLSHEAVAKAVVTSFNNPLSAGVKGGRPLDDDEKVELAIVFREQHEDGDFHFHVVVKLFRNSRFGSAKRTLRDQFQLPSHFSCSHSRLWSALRYCHIGTPAKPDVDDKPWVWTPTWTGPAKDCKTVDLFELSQEPFRADAWRKRKQDKDREAAKKNSKTTFDKLDLSAIIISKHLWTKDSLIAYAQEWGTKAMHRMFYSWGAGGAIRRQTFQQVTGRKVEV